MSEAADRPSELWLGYDSLMAPFEQINAVLAYQPAWNRRIEQTVGALPSGVQAVVLLADGRMLPSRRSLADLHARWTDWQRSQSTTVEGLPDTTPQTDEQA